MPNKNIKMSIANCVTTLCVILLPLMNLQHYLLYIKELVPTNGINNIVLLILIGILGSGAISIFILFQLFKVIFLYAKVKITNQILYFILITAKLIIGLVTNLWLGLQIQDPLSLLTSKTFIFLRESGFYIIFSVLIYCYFSKFYQHDRRQLLPVYLWTFITVVLLNISSWLVTSW